MSESPFDPDQQPEAPPDQDFAAPPGDTEGQLGSLSSLAQSARMKQLKSARMILIFIGVLITV